MKQIVAINYVTNASGETQAVVKYSDGSMAVTTSPVEITEVENQYRNQSKQILMEG
jgi:hypothetical protein